jgi:DNA-binding MarR family transcriptional regulator
MSTATNPAQQGPVIQDHVDRRLEELRGGDLPDLDLDVEGIVERIQGIEKRLRVVMDETLDNHGLSYGEWKLLCSLRRKPDRTSTPGELAGKLELSSGAMTNRLDRMERDGLVRRLPDPRDRRGVRVELTDTGNDSWIESTNTQAIKEALIASALTKSEQHQLNGLLRKLMLALEETAATGES